MSSIATKRQAKKLKITWIARRKVRLKWATNFLKKLRISSEIKAVLWCKDQSDKSAETEWEAINNNWMHKGEYYNNEARTISRLRLDTCRHDRNYFSLLVRFWTFRTCELVSTNNKWQKIHAEWQESRDHLALFFSNILFEDWLPMEEHDGDHYNSKKSSADTERDHLNFLQFYLHW